MAWGCNDQPALGNARATQARVVSLTVPRGVLTSACQHTACGAAVKTQNRPGGAAQRGRRAGRATAARAAGGRATGTALSKPARAAAAYTSFHAPTGMPTGRYSVIARGA